MFAEEIDVYDDIAQIILKESEKKIQDVSNKKEGICLSCGSELIKTSDRARMVCANCGTIHEIDLGSGSKSSTMVNMNTTRNQEVNLYIRLLIENSKYKDIPEKEEIIEEVIMRLTSIQTEFIKRSDKKAYLIAYLFHTSLDKRGYHYPIKETMNYFPDLKINRPQRGEKIVKIISTVCHIEANSDSFSTDPEPIELINKYCGELGISNLADIIIELYKKADSHHIGFNSSIRTRCIGCIYVVLLHRNMRIKLDMISETLKINVNTYKRYALKVIEQISSMRKSKPEGMDLSKEFDPIMAMK